MQLMTRQQNFRKAGHSRSWFILFAFSGVLLAAGLLAGCGKKDAAPDADAGLLAEAVAVRKAFDGSPPSYRYPVEEALKLVRAGAVNPLAYSESMPQLQRLASNTTITPEQKQALETLIQKLQSMGVKPAALREVR